MSNLRDAIKEIDERSYRKFLELGAGQLDKLNPTEDELSLAIDLCIIESTPDTPLNIAQHIISFRQRNILETKDRKRKECLDKLEKGFNEIGYSDLASKILSIKELEYGVEADLIKLSDMM